MCYTSLTDCVITFLTARSKLTDFALVNHVISLKIKKAHPFFVASSHLVQQLNVQPRLLVVIFLCKFWIVYVPFGIYKILHFGCRKSWRCRQHRENTIRRSSSIYVCVPRPYIYVCIKYLTRRKQNVRAKPQKGPPPPSAHNHTKGATKPLSLQKTQASQCIAMDDSIETKAKYAYANGMLKATSNRKGLYKH